LTALAFFGKEKKGQLVFGLFWPFSASGAFIRKNVDFLAIGDAFFKKKCQFFKQKCQFFFKNAGNMPLSRKCKKQ